jgi:hypothetical protein
MLSGFNFPESRMNVGKTLFAQVMEFVPWKTFARIIERHKGDLGVRTLGCADLFRIMAFSQLTWRESLRDIEVCLEANQAKLFHMGIATPPARSTLADALNLRDWRIYHALALRLIAHARVLYAEDASVLGIDASVYALDSTFLLRKLDASTSWTVATWTISDWTRSIRPGPSSSLARRRAWTRGVCIRIPLTAPLA